MKINNFNFNIKFRNYLFINNDNAITHFKVVYSRANDTIIDRTLNSPLGQIQLKLIYKPKANK